MAAGGEENVSEYTGGEERKRSFDAESSVDDCRKLKKVRAGEQDETTGYCKELER